MGGAVGSLSSSTVYSKQCQFESNAATGSAGVFDLVDSSPVSLGMNTFVGNSAVDGDAGVFRLSDNASIELNGMNQIEGNTAVNGSGGVTFVVDFPLTSLPTLPNKNSEQRGSLRTHRCVEHSGASRVVHLRRAT